jgi:hypothetical protein
LDQETLDGKAAACRDLYCFDFQCQKLLCCDHALHIEKHLCVYEQWNHHDNAVGASSWNVKLHEQLGFLHASRWRPIHLDGLRRVGEF